MNTDQLIQASIANQESKQISSGAIVVETGKRTGRSPNDKYIVYNDVTANTVDWGKINKPMATEAFEKLWKKSEGYIQDKQHYSSRLSVGADSSCKEYIVAQTEFAWHHLFITNLFIKCSQDPLPNDWKLLVTPGCFCNPINDETNSDGAVVIDFKERRVLVTGIAYAGEMKKAMFSVMNFLLAQKNILPMHCSSVKDGNENVHVFFGLSGTGKTTLSSDSSFDIIGDDEAGWTADNKVFNIEGGCYAKCINLSKENEPVIYNAIKKGCVLENVVTANGRPDYTDDSITQNSRAAYPLEHIPNRVIENQASGVKSVIFLTCDLYGVLPPVSLLTETQAIDYFLCGYTAKVGSTELGSTSSISPTFSPCFGAPFFPCKPTMYAALLRQRIRDTNASVYLVNTGYHSGEQSHDGKRYSIPFTRSIIHAITQGDFDNTTFEKSTPFNLMIPSSHPKIEKRWFNPKNQWQSESAYDHSANTLLEAISEHLTQFYPEKVETKGSIV